MGKAVAMSAAAEVLPVGFRFRPTDEELVRHYLKGKIAGHRHPDLLVIPDVDLSSCEPWDLPSKSVIKSDDPEWFFFARRDRPKYPGKSPRSNRSTAAGYWKATGKDRLIRSSSSSNNKTLIGIKKTLVFHRGRAPRGLRTPWIIHEYRAAEPSFQSGRNGSFVLYRLFNKQDGETPSKSSRSDLQNGGDDEDKATTSMTSDLSLLAATKPTTADHSMTTNLIATVDGDKEPQEDAFLDVLTQLPDLHAEQRYDGFPNISSPMRPYTDHPFVGNMGDQDFSAYFDSIIAEQNMQDMLIHPDYAEMDKHPAGNIEFDPTALVTSATNSNSMAPLEDSWRKDDYDQRADDTDATRCLSAVSTLQSDTSGHNHETRPQTNIMYGGANLASQCYSQCQLPLVLDPQKESSHIRQLLDSMLEPSSSDMINSEAPNGQGGWAVPPSMQQSEVQDFIDLQQGTAARRVRLVCAVQRAGLTPHLKSEDEAGSCCSTGSSSNSHDEDHVIAGSGTMAGDMMHIEDRGHIPTQVASSVKITDKLQHLSLSEDIPEHIKLPRPRGAGLTQRLKHDSAQSVHQDLQNNNHVPGESSSETTRRSTGSVLRLLWLALLVMAPLLVLVGVWSLLNYWQM